jgi:hypothetical protein
MESIILHFIYCLKFKTLKIPEENFASKYGHSIFAHFFWKKGTFYVACINKNKNKSIKFLFFAWDKKLFFFPENLCANIECPGAHANIFF